MYPAGMGTRFLSACLLAALFAAAPRISLAASIAGWEVQTGALRSSFAGDLHDAFGESRSTFTAGAGLRVRLSGAFSLQPEIRWIHKGGGTGPISIRTGLDTFEFPSIEYVVNYVDLPLLVRIEPQAGGIAHPYLLIGSGVGLKVGGEVRGGDISFTTPLLRYALIFEGLRYSGRDAIDGFRDIDLDATLGLGVGLGRDAGRVTIEARWTEGLLDVTPTSAMPPGRNRAITATLGYAW
jgi:hypothetical protein